MKRQMGNKPTSNAPKTEKWENVSVWEANVALLSLGKYT